MIYPLLEAKKRNQSLGNLGTGVELNTENATK